MLRTLRFDATSRALQLLSGQEFAPLVLRSLLDRTQIERLLLLRECADVGPVHDDGAGHEVIFLHACQANGTLSGECIQVFDRLADAMRAHDPRAACAHAEHGNEASLAVRCVELHTCKPSSQRAQCPLRVASTRAPSSHEHAAFSSMPRAQQTTSAAA